MDLNIQFDLDEEDEDLFMFLFMMNQMNKKGSGDSGKDGCYIATCVYGSYDCPQVWTLRRFRDFYLARSLAGRMFIRIYYAISPTIVSFFGKRPAFRHFWRNRLDAAVIKLKAKGISDCPYEDINWRKG